MTSALTTQFKQGKDIINYKKVRIARIAWLGQLSTDNKKICFLLFKRLGAPEHTVYYIKVPTPLLCIYSIIYLDAS